MSGKRRYAKTAPVKRRRKQKGKGTRGAGRGQTLVPSRDAVSSSRERARRGRRRLNPQELVTLLANPRAPRDLAAALAKGERFHGRELKHVTELPGEGPTLISLGPLEEVVYRATRDTGKRTRWVHKFGQGARLATTVDGRQLVIVPKDGKPFRVDFERGIVG